MSERGPQLPPFPPNRKVRDVGGAGLGAAPLIVAVIFLLMVLFS